MPRRAQVDPFRSRASLLTRALCVALLFAAVASLAATPPSQKPRATSGHSSPDVVVKLGNFASTDGHSLRTGVADVDLHSVYAGRNLGALRIQIAGSAAGRVEGFDGPFIEMTLARDEVLRYLANAQPSRAPAPGDIVTLPVHARLKSGHALYGFAPVSIVGPAAR